MQFRSWKANLVLDILSVNWLYDFVLVPPFFHSPQPHLVFIYSMNIETGFVLFCFLTNWTWEQGGDAHIILNTFFFYAYESSQAKCYILVVSNAIMSLSFYIYNPHCSVLWIPFPDCLREKGAIVISWFCFYTAYVSFIYRE